MTSILSLTNFCIDDDSNHIPLTSEDGQRVTARTTWTLLLYLSSAADGCIGGETVFYPRDRRNAKEATEVAPETGMLLLHKHGDDCMLVSHLSRVDWAIVMAPWKKLANTIGSMKRLR
jgi:hypothetical protein